jgi:hypothetical protein
MLFLVNINLTTVVQLCHHYSSGCVHTTRALLAAGADVSYSALAQFTPLMYASQYAHTSMMRVLIDAGAVVGTRTVRGATAILLAAQSGHADVIALLATAGGDVDAADEDGSTALLSASQFGRCAAIDELLRRGAAVNTAATRTGMTPLMYAAQFGHADCCSSLVGGGADTERVSLLGATALALASAMRMEACMKVLMREGGASVDVLMPVVGARTETPLAYARTHRMPEGVIALLRRVCAHCRNTRGELVECSDCHPVFSAFYCGAACRAADAATHASVCGRRQPLAAPQPSGYGEEWNGNFVGGVHLEATNIRGALINASNAAPEGAPANRTAVRECSRPSKMSQSRQPWAPMLRAPLDARVNS